MFPFTLVLLHKNNMEKNANFNKSQYLEEFKSSYVLNLYEFINQFLIILRSENDGYR